jgi:hypothetical protein
MLQIQERVIGVLRFSLLAILLPSPVFASSIDSYATCLRAFTNLISYVSFAEGDGSVLPPRSVAALDADLQAYVELGLQRFGEQAVQRLASEATEPDEEYIRAALAIHRVDGPEKTFNMLAAVVAPCGGPNGQLKRVLASK